MTKLYEVSNINGTSFMLNPETIETVEVVSDVAVIGLVSGKTITITAASFAAVLTAEKIGYLRFEAKETEKAVAYEDLPDADAEGLVEVAE